MPGPQENAPLPLPVLAPAVADCGGCGVCCLEQSVPPFLDDIDFVPRELLAEVLEVLKHEDERTAQKLPCSWFDTQTRKCKHHEHRPNICREYETGGELCLEIREKYGVSNS